MTGDRADSGVRLAELMAALSLATDLGTGQPMQHAIRACVLAVRLGDACGLSEEQLTSVYYLALLRYIGCTTESHRAAQVFGDEIEALRWSAPIEAGGAAAMIEGILRNHSAGEPSLRRGRRVLTALIGLPRIAHTACAHCEVGRQLALRMGLGPEVQRGLGEVHEYWSGGGLPSGLKGEAIALPVRVVQVAFDAAAFFRLGGIEGALAIVRRRSGKGYDPWVAGWFCREASTLLAGLDSEAPWETVIAAEPGARPQLSYAALDEAAQAIGDFADLKSTYTLGHSTAVAALAAEAATRCHLPQADVMLLRRAGLLHEVGQVGVSSRVWDKPGPLTEADWERLRLHTYYTGRVLSRPHALAAVGALGSQHHERLDGSGYHLGSRAGQQPPAARVLAAACAYQTKTSLRPHRPIMEPDAAAQALQDEARAGRLDGEAVSAVLAAAGHRVRVRRREWPSGLSSREVEVLRLMAVGLANKSIARRLSVSGKTVDTHVQHIYTKIGVSTRAAAALFTMQHELLAGALPDPHTNQENT